MNKFSRLNRHHSHQCTRNLVHTVIVVAAIRVVHDHIIRLGGNGLVAHFLLVVNLFIVVIIAGLVIVARPFVVFHLHLL